MLYMLRFYYRVHAKAQLRDLSLKLVLRERMRGQREVVAASREALLEELPLPRAVGGGFGEHGRFRPLVCGHETSAYLV